MAIVDSEKADKHTKKVLQCFKITQHSKLFVEKCQKTT